MRIGLGLTLSQPARPGGGAPVNIWGDPGVDNGSAYSAAAGSGTWGVSGGAMSFAAVSAKTVTFVVANFTTSLVNGGVYDIAVTVANYSANSGCSASLGNGSAVPYGINGNGQFTARVTCGATTSTGRLATSTSGCTFDITDISVVRIS